MDPEQVKIMMAGINTSNVKIITAIHITLMQHNNNFTLSSNHLATQIALVCPNKQSHKCKATVSSTSCQDGGTGGDSSNGVDKTVNNVEINVAYWNCCYSLDEWKKIPGFVRQLITFAQEYAADHIDPFFGQNTIYKRSHSSPGCSCGGHDSGCGCVDGGCFQGQTTSTLQ